MRSDRLLAAGIAGLLVQLLLEEVMTRNDITGDRIASPVCCPTDDGPEKDEK